MFRIFLVIQPHIDSMQSQINSMRSLAALMLAINFKFYFRCIVAFASLASLASNCKAMNSASSKVRGTKLSTVEDKCGKSPFRKYSKKTKLDL